MRTITLTERQSDLLNNIVDLFSPEYEIEDMSDFQESLINEGFSMDEIEGTLEEIFNQTIPRSEE